MKSVAVVGGGITGLTAAFRLQQRGIPVVLYEATGRVGGYLHTIESEGFIAELGPNTILETSPKISTLIQDVGLESRRRYSDPSADRNFVVRGGTPVPLPKGPMAFIQSPLFSTGAKLQLFKEPFVGRAPENADETVAEFVVRRLGREFLDYAINPLVSGIYAGNPEKLSVKQAFPKLNEVEQKYGSLILGQFLGARERKRRGEVSKQAAKKLSFEKGLRELPEAILSKLGDSVRLGAQVVSLRRSADGWTIRYSQEGQRNEEEHSSVILTAPAHRLARVALEDQDQLSLFPLGRVEHSPVAVVHLGFRREDVAHPLDGFGYLIPQVENLQTLGTTFSSTIFPNRAPLGHVLLTTFAGGCRNPELVEKTEDAIFEATMSDLRKLLGVRGEPVFKRAVRFPLAIPQYNVGYQRFKELMTEAEAQLPGLCFAGTYRDGISVANAICSGHDAAERIAERLPVGVS